MAVEIDERGQRERTICSGDGPHGGNATAVDVELVEARPPGQPDRPESRHS
jgi:hypothetical protein